MTPLMRIGCDVDGVVASWNNAFVRLIKQETGIEIDTTAPWPTMWQWPKQYLKSSTITKLWNWIKANPWWWRMLEATDTGYADLRLLEQLSRAGHAVYFITNRPGHEAQRQTAVWLSAEMLYPTVLLAKDANAKALLCEGLGLDLMIDDRPANVEACQRAGTRTFLRDQPYNKEFNWPDRIGSVQEMWNQVQVEHLGKAA